MLQTMIDVTGVISNALWGLPALVLLMGTGIYVTIRLNFIQFRGFRQSYKILTETVTAEQGHHGETTPFQALCTSLSATVGTGNIAGVATAIVLGGPGAMFWMWITALVGMAMHFIASTLAVQYRQFDKKGHIIGGPMVVLKYALNMPKLAMLFALFTVIASFGIGSSVQANSIVDGLTYLLPSLVDHKIYLGLTLAFLVGLVIVGGIKRIAHVAEFIVPFMAIAYFIAAGLILVIYANRIIPGFITIFDHALNWSAFGGSAIGMAIRYGVARGVFSNESGLGSAAIAHATAKVNHPVRQGLVAMLGPFIDTIVICTLTGLVLIVTGCWGEGTSSLNGAALTTAAFNIGTEKMGFANLGGWLVAGSLIFFAYTTIIGWAYYGDRCAQFLLGDWAVLPYRLVFCSLTVVGAVFPLQLVWNFADIANILMAIPNIICTILLCGVTKTLQQEYFAKYSSNSVESSPD